jgi:hypothetical protein
MQFAIICSAVREKYSYERIFCLIFIWTEFIYSLLRKSEKIIIFNNLLMLCNISLKRYDINVNTAYLF